MLRRYERIASHGGHTQVLQICLSHVIAFASHKIVFDQNNQQKKKEEMSNRNYRKNVKYDRKQIVSTNCFMSCVLIFMAFDGFFFVFHIHSADNWVFDTDFFVENRFMSQINLRTMLGEFVAERNK